MLDYSEAQRIVVEGKPTALEWFIVENEPANIREATRFRRELQDVIDESVMNSLAAPVAVDDTQPLTPSEFATAWFCIGCVFAVTVISVGMIAWKGFTQWQ